MKKKLLFYILFFNIFLANASSNGNLNVVEAFVIENEEDNYNHLETYLYCLVDSTNSIVVEDILNSQYNFVPHNQLFETQKANPDYALWGYIRLVNPKRHKIKTILNTSSIGTNYVDVYYRDIDGNLIHKKTGEYVPYDEKDIKNSRSNKVNLEISAGTYIDVYFRIKNKDNRTPRFQISLESNNSFHRSIESRNIFQGVFLGVISIMVLYNFFLYFFSKDKAYIYYAMYIASTIFYFIYHYGFALTTFAQDIPELNAYIYVFTGVATVYFFQFIRKFMDTAQLIPVWDKILLWVIRIRSSIIVLELSILATTFNYDLVASISTNTLLIIVLFSSVLLIVLLKTRSSIALYLIFGTMSLKIMALVATYLLYYWEISNAIGFIQLGIILEILLFSLGLGYRFKINDEQRIIDQQKLIQQLQDSEKKRTQLNKELEHINHELEGKVQERTEKIREHQQEIAIQAKELVEMNWELYEKNDRLYKINYDMELANKALKSKNKELEILNEKLNKTLAQLKAAQVQLIQSEKMASVGLLTAGIAHEINNPINFVYAGADTLQMVLKDLMEVLDQYDKITPENSYDEIVSFLEDMKRLKNDLEFEENKEDAYNLLNDIREGAERTAEIVRGLRVFSRLDEDELKTANIHDGIESTLTLLRNQIKTSIEVVKEYDKNMPPVECYPGQLNQVFMNILVNAVHAIKDGPNNEIGKISIKTVAHSMVLADKYADIADDGYLEIIIEDNGNGIPEDVQERIFEPFYTTKQVGEGTGLGLSISHSIIQKHNGDIKLESETGKGARFIIKLPIKQA
ncbi:7TM diverse intracellular signaling domain-containing protein [Chondrinema litorale]|uniref:7TM diverse intracellular signaling domain-containing protein n=1 Tax=Chondrinema litorale TaxID=2994555 RepID=UPI0025436931|nr:7TM diverse intracellular signaling domain-containing protein [Chondrinema litorale]UZR94780.1 ATP-binding protein [Chondrinema litorale]